MIVTKHAVRRFRERIMNASYSFIEQFIKRELQESVLLYSINGIEKRYVNGIVYVLERSKGLLKVVTLYPKHISF
jgi:transposase